MKLRIMAVAAVAALALAGCATTEEAKQAAPAPDPQLSRWESFAAALASAKDTTAQVAISMAFVIDSRPPAAPIVVQQPQSIAGLLFSTALGILDRGISVYGIVSGSKERRAVSRDNRDVMLGAFGSIERSGAAALPYIQAPGAITNYSIGGDGVIGSGSFTGAVTTTNNTTTTLSGTGVIGSGSNVGPVTRTCGGGGAGTSTTGGSPGGPASC
jgi:hypothetical protein